MENTEGIMIITNKEGGIISIIECNSEEFEALMKLI